LGKNYFMKKNGMIFSEIASIAIIAIIAYAVFKDVIDSMN